MLPVFKPKTETAEFEMLERKKEKKKEFLNK